MMEWKVKTYTLDMPDEPAKVLADAKKEIVFNAARPLPGTTGWNGDFHHGSFYAAISPLDPNATRFVKECISLDGWFRLYVSESEVRQWAKEWFLLQEGYALPADFEYVEMFQSFTNQTWGKVRTLMLSDGVFTVSE